MRSLVTGVDDAGRSCVLEERVVAFGEIAPRLAVDVLHRTEDSPPRARPPGRAAHVDLGVPPGRCSWSVWRFDPGGEVGMHHTDTIDFEVVLAGSVELILDDGAHLLEVGDCVVMTGVDHAWRAGADGCTVGVVALGSRLRA